MPAEASAAPRSRQLVRPNSLFVWYRRASELAKWAMTHLVNRTDVWIAYRSEAYRGEGKERSYTAPAVESRGITKLTRDILVSHFQGNDVGDLVGLHAITAVSTCKWVGVDIDQHGTADADANHRYARHLHKKLASLGFRPLLTDSNGDGGFHLLLVFSEPITSASAFHFGRWLVRDFAEFSLAEAPETFPKQPALATGGYCNALRLPGRHHTRWHWSKVWDGREWLSDDSAINFVLAIKGDDPALLPAEAAPPPNAPAPAQPVPAGEIADITEEERIKRCHQYVSQMPPSISGQRGHDKAFAAACECFRFGLARESARVVMGKFNERCSPAWSDAELEHKLSDAGAAVGNEFGVRLRNDGEQTTLEQRARYNSDIGNAARLAIQHGRNIRYNPVGGKWLRWDEQRWMPVVEEVVMEFAKQTALRLYDEIKEEPDEGRRQFLAKHANQSQAVNRLLAMLKTARSDLIVMPSKLDTDPNLLNVINGVVDLRTGELRPACREDMFTKICGAAYRPGSIAPVFQQFLARIFRGRPGLIQYVQKALGYTATGLVTEQCLFFLYGSGRNGKTTLMDVVSLALGDYALKAAEGILMARRDSTHPTELADLAGARLAICSESEEGRRFNSARLKDLTGESRVKARKMHEDFTSFQATWKLWLYSNHLPSVTDSTEGFWRRMRVLPFSETISESERDPELPKKLEAEVDAILTWIIQGAVRWHREGLGEPPEVLDATRQYRNDADTLGVFLRECCVHETHAEEVFAEIYAMYQRWAQRNGEQAESQRQLGQYLRGRGFASSRDRHGNRIYCGIRFRRPTDSPAVTA